MLEGYVSHHPTLSSMLAGADGGRSPAMSGEPEIPIPAPEGGLTPNSCGILTDGKVSETQALGPGDSTVDHLLRFTVMHWEALLSKVPGKCSVAVAPPAPSHHWFPIWLNLGGWGC